MEQKPTYEELKQRIKELEKEAAERKQLEKELRESRHYYSSLFNQLHEDILIVDRNYRITDVNKAFLLTIGHAREKVIGRHCYEISHGSNKPCKKHGEECPLHKVFTTGKPHTSCHQHTHVKGWKVWVYTLMSPLKDEKGKVTHIIEVIRNMDNFIKVVGRSLQNSVK